MTVCPSSPSGRFARRSPGVKAAALPPRLGAEAGSLAPWSEGASGAESWSRTTRPGQDRPSVSRNEKSCVCVHGGGVQSQGLAPWTRWVPLKLKGQLAPPTG